MCGWGTWTGERTTDKVGQLGRTGGCWPVLDKRKTRPAPPTPAHPITTVPVVRTTARLREAWVGWARPRRGGIRALRERERKRGELAFASPSQKSVSFLFFSR